MKSKINNLTVVCIIPARGGSKGIPKKNIIDISGKPLIAWSIEQALFSKYIKDNVYVSSDCEDILNISKEFGSKLIKRPLSLSGDLSSSEDALIHALEKIQKEIGKIDLVVFLQATSPLREFDDIDNAINILIEKEYDSLFSANIYSGGFLWIEENKSFKSFNYDYKNRQRRQDKINNYVENGSFYIFKPEILLNERNRLGGKVGIYLMDEWKSFEIDEISDIELVNFYITNRIQNDK